MLLLLETPAGFGLFRLNDKSIVEDPDSVFEHFEDAGKAQKAISLEAFSKFKDTKVALEAITSISENEVGKSLKKFLKKSIVDAGLTDQLAVCDKALGGAINKKLGIDCIYNTGANEVIRGIRMQLHELVEGLQVEETKQMALGLAHTLSRFKLKFSPDKVDTMIVQAIGLLDDIDKELNNFAMRLREWYGWHFPELAKVVSDNAVYAQVVKAMGMRTNAKSANLDGIVPDEVLAELKRSAEVSMGTEITEEDLANIQELCDRVVDLGQNRAALSDYLKQRMETLAPNLTHMVGELVGARLISHAGSLMNLAKHPSSTVQILGAEKALFRALKQKKNTPKYGLIYHASLVGQAQPKTKGKISRVLAAKLSQCSRVDALSEGCTDSSFAEDCKDYVERRLQNLESGASMKVTKTGKATKTEKYTPPKADGKSGSAAYNADADAAEDMEGIELVKKKKEKKEKKEKKVKEEEVVEEEVVEKKKKDKKRKHAEVEETVEAVEEPTKKKKKKSKAE